MVCTLFERSSQFAHILIHKVYTSESHKTRIKSTLTHIKSTYVLSIYKVIQISIRYITLGYKVSFVSTVEKRLENVLVSFHPENSKRWGYETHLRRKVCVSRLSSEPLLWDV